MASFNSDELGRVLANAVANFLTTQIGQQRRHLRQVLRQPQQFPLRQVAQAQHNKIPLRFVFF